MANLTLNVNLDPDLKTVFNSGHMLDAVRQQLIREVGGDKGANGLDTDLQPVYLIDTPLYKELACSLQVLRIVQTSRGQPTGAQAPAPVSAAPTITAL